MSYFYAQLDENNVCIGVSDLKGIAPRENVNVDNVYDLETGDIVSTKETRTVMVRIPVYTSQYIGKKYLNQGKWGSEDEILPFDETLEFGYEPPAEEVPLEGIIYEA